MSKKSIENDLSILNSAYVLAPTQGFETKQSESSESIYKILAKIEDSLTAIRQTSTPDTSHDLSPYVKMLSDKIGEINNTFGSVAMVSEQQHQMITKLQVILRSSSEDMAWSEYRK